MTKVTSVGEGEEKIDTAYEVYMALYHQLVGKEGKPDPFLEVQSNFFDLIIVDECHRGSAKDDSAWRKVLEYFSSATQIGMTATPKQKMVLIISTILESRSILTPYYKESRMASWLPIV